LADHPWNFDNGRTHSLLLRRILDLLEKYEIREKKDWYRVPLEISQIDLFRRLKEVYPDVHWSRDKFLSRGKRTHQRLLYSMTRRIYPCHLVIENYRHPRLLFTTKLPLEYDIFLPALNLAMEYQGEQHFDDMPSSFPGIELFQIRDQYKEIYSSQLSIKLVYIPFWWNNSYSSLLSTLQATA
jgi:hypothetical protein